jgi:hypothetical protein
MKDSEKSRKNWELGQDILAQYLMGKSPGGDKVKIALQACNQHAKMIASEANHDTNKLVMARMIYQNPKELEEYIKKSMPKMLEK